MSLAKHLIRSSSWMFASDIIGNLLSFFLVVIIARVLGDTGLGIYSYTFAFVGSIFFIFDMGILYYAAKEMSRDIKNVKIYSGNLLTLRLASCFLAVIVSVITTFSFSKDPVIYWTVLLASVAMFFNYFSWVFRPVFQAHEKLKFEALSKIIERIAAFSLGVYFLLILKKGIIAFMLVFVLSYLIFYIIRVIFTKRIATIDFNFDWTIIKEIIKKSLPFWSIIIFIKLYLTVNILMISWLTKDYAMAGWYTAASSLLEGLNFIPATTAIILFPTMSNLFVKNQRSLKNLLNVSFKYYSILVFSISVGIYFLADKIIFLVYSGTFVQSVIVLQMLVWAVTIGFFTQFFGVFLQSINRQNLYAVLIFMAVLLNVILNLILIPRFGHVGASMAVIITEIASFIVLYYSIIKSNFRIKLFRLSLPALVAGMFMGIFLYVFQNLNLFFLIFAGAVVFFIVLILVGGIRKEDINLLKEAVG